MPKERLVVVRFTTNATKRHPSRGGLLEDYVGEQSACVEAEFAGLGLQDKGICVWFDCSCEQRGGEDGAVGALSPKPIEDTRPFLGGAVGISGDLKGIMKGSCGCGMVYLHAAG
jgi:hypothetical protein